ncbi:hypothetical protein LR48_Vigan02g122200 [Vigna angularis]|uniref:Uncharacterized protein n=1 Tax=Phaseolus angularis TaxID=3914 RepID=A0A0L9TXF3_PHAAN|nr:hypothetical protein LR48_Vigan02g122200 [Vigna angularis]
MNDHVEDDLVVEMEAVEEEAFQEEAVEAHVDEDKHHDDVPDIDKVVSGFPGGEMYVTLDNVSMLLDLLVLGKFCDMEELEFEEARATLVELLGVDRGMTGAEMEEARGCKSGSVGSDKFIFSGARRSSRRMLLEHIYCI